MSQKITMTETRPGASDGHTVRTYEKGETYEVSDDLAKDFLAAKVATPAKAGTKTADEKATDDKK